MKIIIAGSREIKNKILVWKAVSLSNFIITEVVSGMARGVDTIALDIAKELKVPVAKFPAFWKEHGKKAGYYRNCAMAEYVGKKQSGEIGGLIAIWDGESRGTKMMIDIAKKEGLKVYVYKI